MKARTLFALEGVPNGAKAQVTIYTDGACTGNPGPGGYGTVLIFDDNRRELSGGFRLTTNNRMELLAAIEGLEALKEPCQVTLYSDSSIRGLMAFEGLGREVAQERLEAQQEGNGHQPDMWGRLA